MVVMWAKSNSDGIPYIPSEHKPVNSPLIDFRLPSTHHYDIVYYYSMQYFISVGSLFLNETRCKGLY